jgi:hypothetical protein
MSTSLPVLSGLLSTSLFVASTLPMLHKAWRTRDLRSYSLGTLLLSSTGNAVHTVYVLSLPPGPIWVLHGFYTVTTALMLVGYLRYEGVWRRLRSGATVDERVDDPLMVPPYRGFQYRTPQAIEVVTDRAA